MTTHQIPGGPDIPEPPRWTWPTEGRTVADLVERIPTVIDPHAKARSAELLASNLGVHHLPVVDDYGSAVGILCSCDLRSVDPEAEVMDCMSAPPVTVDGAMPVGEAAEMFRLLDLGALLVLEDHRLLGVVTRGDLRRAGLFSETDFPRCVVCRSRHHVRIDSRTGLAVCLDCKDEARRRILQEADDGITGGD